MTFALACGVLVERVIDRPLGLRTRDTVVRIQRLRCSQLVRDRLAKGGNVVEIKDEDRPQVLNATATAMRTVDGLLDPHLLERIAAVSGVDSAVVARRWGSGASLIADVLSDKGGIATPGWPQAADFAGAKTHAILAALIADLTAALDGDRQLTQAALSQVIANPVVRQVWSDCVEEDLEQWTDILADAKGSHAPIDRARAAQAVHLVAGQCYSRALLGELASSISNDRMIDIAVSLLDTDNFTP